MSLIDNLVHYWKLKGDSNDTKGTNNGTDTGISYISGGKCGYSAYLDGDDGDGIALANQVDTSGNNISISVWIKGSSNSGYQTIIANYTTGASPENSVVVRCVEGVIDTYIRDSGGVRRVNSFSYLVDTWYHIVMTYDGSTFKQYINGSLQDTITGGGNILSCSNAWRIGALHNGTTTTNVFNGMIQHIAIWSREITSAEVTSLYNSGSGIFYNKTDFVSCAVSSATKIYVRRNGVWV